MIPNKINAFDAFSCATSHSNLSTMTRTNALKLLMNSRSIPLMISFLTRKFISTDAIIRFSKFMKISWKMKRKEATVLNVNLIFFRVCVCSLYQWIFITLYVVIRIKKISVTREKANILVIHMQEKWDPLTWSDTCIYKV